MTLRDEILEQPAAVRAAARVEPAGDRRARRAAPRGAGRLGRDRGPRDIGQRGDLRPVRPWNGQPPAGRPRRAVDPVPLRGRAAVRPGARRGHQPVGPFAGRRRGRRGRPAPGRPDARDHERPDERARRGRRARRRPGRRARAGDRGHEDLHDLARRDRPPLGGARRRLGRRGRARPAARRDRAGRSRSSPTWSGSRRTSRRPTGVSSSAAATSTPPPASGRSSSRSSAGSSPTRTRPPTSSTGRSPSSRRECRSSRSPPRGWRLPAWSSSSAGSAERGADLLVLSDEAAIRAIGNRSIALPEDVPEWLRPIVSIVPAQLYAYHVTRARGLDPEAPRNVSKVTRTR